MKTINIKTIIGGYPLEKGLEKNVFSSAMDLSLSSKLRHFFLFKYATSLGILVKDFQQGTT
jgi:hypothetical protein